MALFKEYFDGRRALVALALTFLLGSTAWNAVAQAQQNQQASVRSDADLQTDVAAALAASPVLNGQEVNAAVASGEVTLSGYVDDQASKDLAQIVASKVNGVRSVVNNLSVVPIGAPQSPAPATTEQAPDGQQQMPPNVADQQEAPPAEYPPSGGQDRAPYPGQQAQQDQYPPQNAHPMPTIPVQLPLGTLLNVRLIEPLDTKHAASGAFFQATSANDIYVGGVLAVPRGAVLVGQVVDVTSTKGSLSGHSSLSLKLNSLTLEGRTYPLNTDVWVGNGPGKGSYSAGNTITGATIGAVIGGIAGGGAGAAVGATIGGATGAVASSASSTPRVVLPPETRITFHLATPIFVTPVSYQEAQRLAAGQPAGGPTLQSRPGYPPPPAVVYGYPYGYAGAYPYAYAYGYPSRYYYPGYRVYYRPYR